MKTEGVLALLKEGISILGNGLKKAARMLMINCRVIDKD